ncbi:hypothetical protein [Streptomyces sp. GbtcB6]|uniref:hypothetical protein n=1 Tax=Streptomyces sp. GbtcB6 TaxID=2824751 RepID=UPI001C2F41CC|nr:hypothetical protein [Streptomyces sp. GbtcB6]
MVAGVVVAGLALAGCSGSDDERAGGKEASSSPSVDVTSADPSPTPTPSPYVDDDGVLMAKGDCYAAVADPVEAGQVQEVACDDAAAEGKVVYYSTEDLDGRISSSYAPYCPDNADDVLGITRGTGMGQEFAGHSNFVAFAAATQYACVRYLKGPHPGDPGGGGMEIRVGDCLAEEDERYKEVACEGDDVPGYKVVAETAKGEDCPRKNDILLSTDTLLSRVGLDVTAYCARAL